MRDPRKFGLVLDLAYSTATAVSAIFGMCSYYIWGPETAAVVATNLPSGPGTTLVGSLLCIVLICSYPLQMLPISDIFDAWMDAGIDSVKGLFRKGGEFEAVGQNEPGQEDKKAHRVSCSDVVEVAPRRILARILQAAVTFSVAVAFPNLGNFVSLVGCIGFSLGGYLLPALCYYKHFKVKLPRQQIGLVFMCIWSIFFVMLPGIVTNTRAILHPAGGKS
jgi:amino acid permease